MILWHKIDQETSLPQNLVESERLILERIFDPTNPTSVWCRALAMAGLPRPRHTIAPLIRWEADTLFINWTAMVLSISCGITEPVPVEGGFGYKSNFKLLRMFSLFYSQWKTEILVQDVLNSNLVAYDFSHMNDKDLYEKICESLALGFAMHLMMLRLPIYKPQDFASWLAAPDSAPAHLRKTVKKIQAIQKHRTRLSPAWLRLFAPRPSSVSSECETLLFFWNDPPSKMMVEKNLEISIDSESIKASSWHGKPVCPGIVQSDYILIDSLQDFPPSILSKKQILIFTRAHPDTTEYFQFAQGLVFIQGGALAHACTIAREMMIPSVTGLGFDFLKAVRSRPAGSVLQIDGMTGAVQFVDSDL